MSRSKLLKQLYRFRVAISTVMLLCLLYFAVYVWLVIPSPAFLMGWQPDTELRILPNVAPDLPAGAQVVAINGRSVARGHPIFTYPIQSAYTLTLAQNGDVWQQTISASVGHELALLWNATATILAIAFWLMGWLMVQFTRQPQMQTLLAGFGFQLIGVGILSPGPSQLGAPNVWLVGHVLIYLFPLIILYLGWLPYEGELRPFPKRILQTGGVVVAVFALIALIEALFLFPEQSVQSLLGISTGAILAVLTAVSILVSLVTLFWRLFATSAATYERQQLQIVAFFLTLALLPLLLFLLLPIGHYLFVPYPVLYSLLLLLPVAYFFVLHRRGYLALDLFFSRFIMIVILVVAVSLLYVSGSYFYDMLIDPDLGQRGQQTFLLLLFGLAFVAQRPLRSLTDVLVYGRDTFADLPLQEVQSRLSSQPEPATVEQVILDVAKRLYVAETAVLLLDDGNGRYLAGNVSPFSIPLLDNGAETVLRVEQPQLLAPFPDWVEAVIPIKARGDLLGIYLLARPLGGYFNARQVRMLQDVADILAFGLLVITLIDSMQQLSQQALYEKELQRQQIATEIHNEPLHTLATVTMQLGQSGSEEDLRQAAAALRRVTKDLRRIISGLRPPALKESVNWMCQQVVRAFSETHPDICVDLQIVSTPTAVPELTKNAFYYVLTEALNNISKHAQATAVQVKVTYEQELLTLAVQDNGVGHTNNLSLVSVLRNQHLGIADMHRWALLAHGRLRISSHQPTGLHVLLTLPISSQASFPTPANLLQ